ncbi:MAG: DNA topoisomerase [Ruminococcus sp.]|nr:DNA topoisomerase [Ruminococcus sp.]MBQ7134615.1 DNA topoisomerase [Ruminococcus sp.]
MAKPKKKPEYGNESIVTLKGADRVRKRPAVIFGSDGIEGCQHSVFEILSNSIDEAREGYGKLITVTRYQNGSIEIEDHGRGIPVDYNKNEDRYNWELVFCELYAGGKYNNNEGNNYEYSLGLNGLGLCSTQYSSEYMDVDIRRDGKRYTLHFEKGENVGGLKVEDYAKKDTGSKITWKPDLEVFTDIDIQPEYFADVLKRQAIVNAGIKFVFRNQVGRSFETQEFLYENGIEDHVKELVSDTGMSTVQSWQTERKVRDRDDKDEYKCKINVALAFSNKVNATEYYHNSSYLEHGGAPEKAVRNAFVYMIDNYLKQNSKYTKNESKITFADVEDCLIIIISSFSSVTSYENQTKKAITNKGIQDAMTEFLRRQLEIYFIENPLEAEKIGAQVLINKRSREDAEKTRVRIKKNLTSNMDMTSRVAKFVDCRSKDVDERELFIVEGDSALGACKQARNPDFQAIIPIRGKILNCLKADYDRIFKSEIITDLLKVLGCGVQVKSKANKDLSNFDINNLRWSKVIFCTDADVDGFQIRTLLLTMIYRLTPDLIEAGKVFIAESPLYEITAGDKVYFAYTEAEKEQYIEEIGNKKFTVQRSKGLGENEPDMMSLTTMNPQTRRLIKVMPDDAEKTSQIFDILLGDNLQGRKDFIVENGADYTDNLDVS